MTGILITFQFASIAFLIWVFVQGLQVVTPASVRSHIVMALAATAINVFSHSLTMMYVVAVGRMIREAVEQKHLDSKYVAQTKNYRKTIFKVATLAMLAVMVQTILGGGVHTRLFPLWFHFSFGLAALLISGWASYLEVRYLIENHLLGHRVAREFETRR